MPNEYAKVIHVLFSRKSRSGLLLIEIETQKREPPKVVNIMDALQQSMPGKGQTKVRDEFASGWAKSPHRKPGFGINKCQAYNEH